MERRAGGPAAREGLRGSWPAAAAGLFGALLYAGTIANGFVFDDVSLVERNPLAQDPAALKAIFTSHYWSGIFPASDLYRPLTIWSFAVNHVLAGGSPAGYHAVNALLHGAVCALVVLLGSSLGLSSGLALAAGLLFAAHPVHVEAVAPVVGRSELMAAGFALIAWICHRRAFGESEAPAEEKPAGGPALWTVAALASYAAALLSKEGAAALPALIALVEAARRRPGASWSPIALRLLPMLALTGVWLLWRARVLPVIPPDDTAVHVFTGVDAATRIRTAVGVLGRYLILMLFPARLSADYSFRQIPFIESWLDPLFLGSALAHAALAAAGMWLALRRRLSGAAILIYLVALFPVSNIPFAIGTHMAERLLYLPSVGLCLLGPALASGPGRWRSSPRLRAAAAAALLLILGLYSARTIARVRDWRDQRSIFTATVEASPRSAKARYGLAHTEQESGNAAAAIDGYREAIAIKPDYVEARIALGRLLLGAGRFAEAVEHLQMAARIDPSSPGAHRDLGRALQGSGRAEEAAASYEEEVRRRPDDAGARVDLGSVLLDLGRTAEALPHLERAVELAPSDESAQGRWIVGLFLAGRKEEAYAALDRAVAASPEFASRLPDFARVASALGLTDLAGAALARTSNAPR